MSSETKKENSPATPCDCSALRILLRDASMTALIFIEEVMYDNELRWDGGEELRPMHLQTADMRMPFWKAKN